jgi:putative AlgH/UPF0301 family transcriptional regulator
MKNWKIVQDLYHKLNTEHTDDLNQVNIRFSEDVVYDALLHFTNYVDEWIYPAKSYFVAICYASWIASDFNEDFYDLLNDKMLLAGNDPYFIEYSKSKEIYDSIIKHIDINNIEMTGMVPDVRRYYNEEFRMWHESAMVNSSF